MTINEAVPEAERWFGSADMRPPLPSGAAEIVRELVRLLDSSKPDLLDRNRSWIRVQGQSSGARTLKLHIAHRHDDSASVDVLVSVHEAAVLWLGAEEYIEHSEGTGDRHWTSTVVDVVAAAIRGEYAVETLRRGGRVVRARVIDQVRDGLVINETALLFGWLHLGRRTTETRQLDYGVRR